MTDRGSASHTPHGVNQGDSEFALEQDEAGQTLAIPALARWIGWQLRLLVACALLGCVAIFALTRSLANEPSIDAHWRASAQNQIELVGSELPALHARQGQTLVAVSAGATHVTLGDTLALQRSARWIIDDTQRLRHRLLHDQLHGVLASATLTLTFADGSKVDVEPRRRGFAALPALYWLLVGFGLTLFLVAAVMLLGQPSVPNLLFALMAWCQAGNLLFIAVESTLQLGLPAPWPRLDMPLRMSFDLVTAAAMVNAACLRPRRLPGSGTMALLGWVTAALLIVFGQAGWLPQLWWWVQSGASALGLIAIGLLTWSYRIEPHPFAIVLRRFGIIGAGTWVLLTLALSAADGLPVAPGNIAAIGSMIWYVFLGSLLLLLPFLAKPRLVMREFALLAAITTVATSLDLLFVAVFSLGQFASLTLSLFISLAVYSGTRQWLLNQLLGSSVLTTERMFEQLYRIAREVEARPERTAQLLLQLLRELFDPVETRLVERQAQATRLAGDGSSLLVPVPALTDESENLGGNAVLVRFAHRGRRLFTSEDARLTDRIVEQLRRAVVFDKAVEQGRKEERLRLAQDLHDDIGARLLTLMYKAQSPEMEDYLRHTLQDLKTLTRGLAASNHRLSHSAAEWKADLTQRLTAAQIELRWSVSFDDDILLTVVQWSALTRVLRELVSNAIAHAQAQHLEIEFNLEKDRLELGITDNGTGSNPRAWSHGLGLGGVRKRVKQLGGEVEWREVAPHGISCRVSIRRLTARR